MHQFTRLLVALTTLFVVACAEPASQPETTDTTQSEPPAEAVTTTVESTSLAEILAAQPEEVQARYGARNPQATLEFFGIEPGMTVIEALPGGGWYSKLLLPYLGSDGHLIGVNYAPDIWPLFPNMPAERIAQMAEWVTTWTAGAQEWRGENSATVSAATFGALPEGVAGTADAVLFIRAMHNMARFNERPFLAEAMADAYTALKPGGVVGIVQHKAPEGMTDEWANGSRGYLKQQFVIDQMEAAGFEFVAASGINENALDQPGEADFVWRLPPSLATSRDNPELAEQMQAIGESNRMTLKFVKPSA